MAIQWEGGWSGISGLSQITYYEGDIVSYENIVYIVQKGVPIVPIGSAVPPLDLTKWDVLVAGSVGTNGAAGTSGADGTGGTSGTSGISGVAGTSGTSGTSGPAGTSGVSGTSGLSGVSGTSGADGVGFTYYGAWVLFNAYGVNDIVRYGLPYRVYAANQNIEPNDTAPDVNSKWTLMVISGSNGQTLSPKGVEVSYADMIANHPTPDNLDTYILQDTSELWVYDPGSSGADANGWVNMGEIQGPAGLDGSSGSSGTSGTVGTSGSSGSSGTSGISGVAGTSGTSGTTPPGKTYTYTSGTAGTSWTITHLTGANSPLVQVYDTNRIQLIPATVEALDENTVRVDFATAVNGTAIVSSGWNGTSGTSGSSGIGFPGGGTSGQVLIKNSSTSGDASWQTFNDVNVFEATFNAGQVNAVTTPWGLTIYVDSAGQQFYFSGSSAAAAKYTFGHRISSYARIVSGVYGTSNLAWQVFTAGTWYPFWGDTTLNMTAHGDYEYGVFRAAASQNAFSLGQYEEFEYVLVVGSGFLNNTIRIRKTK